MSNREEFLKKAYDYGCGIADQDFRDKYAGKGKALKEVAETGLKGVSDALKKLKDPVKEVGEKGKELGKEVIEKGKARAKELKDMPAKEIAKTTEAKVVGAGAVGAAAGAALSGDDDDKEKNAATTKSLDKAKDNPDLVKSIMRGLEESNKKSKPFEESTGSAYHKSKKEKKANMDDAPNYRQAEDPMRACGSCAHYNPMDEEMGLCAALDFHCMGKHVCDAWEGGGEEGAPGSEEVPPELAAMLGEEEPPAEEMPPEEPPAEEMPPEELPAEEMPPEEPPAEEMPKPKPKDKKKDEDKKDE